MGELVPCSGAERADLVWEYSWVVAQIARLSAGHPSPSPFLPALLGDSLIGFESLNGIRLYRVQCTVYSVHFTLYIEHSTQYSVHNIVHFEYMMFVVNLLIVTILFTFYRIFEGQGEEKRFKKPCTYKYLSTVYRLQCTSYSLQCTLKTNK